VIIALVRPIWAAAQRRGFNTKLHLLESAARGHVTFGGCIGGQTSESEERALKEWMTYPSFPDRNGQKLT
jgi:hypothetical protein